MGKTLVIAEQSEIIRKGLVQIAESIGYFDRIYEVVCASNLDSALTKYCPEVLLINPSFTSKDFRDTLNDDESRTVKLGAIVYALFDDDVINRFDEQIMISDTRGKDRKSVV